MAQNIWFVGDEGFIFDTLKIIPLFAPPAAQTVTGPISAVHADMPTIFKVTTISDAHIGEFHVIGIGTGISYSGFVKLTGVASSDHMAEISLNALRAKNILTEVIPDSYAADGSQPTIPQGILAIKQFLEERSVSGTTVTVRKPNGATTAMTFTLDHATLPTSITRAS